MSMSCNAHGRRVMYFPNFIVHRNGDGSKCSSKLFRTGKLIYTSGQLRAYAAHSERKVS